MASTPAYSWRDSLKTADKTPTMTSRFGESGITASKYGESASATARPASSLASRYGEAATTTSRFGEGASTTSRFGEAASTTSRFGEDRPSYLDKNSKATPAYSWRDSLKVEKAEDPKPSYSSSWRDSYKSDKSYTDAKDTSQQPAYSWRDSLKSDKNYDYSGSKAAEVPDDNRARTLERRASKKDSLPGYESAIQRTLDRSSNISDRIEQTLSKHNAGSLQEQPAWRTREQSTTRQDSLDRNRCKMLQDRGTSPEAEAGTTTRVGRDSEPYSVRLTKYVTPLRQDMAVQTEQFFLKDRSEKDTEAFDYFDHVKKTMQYINNNPVEKQKLEERIELFNTGEEKHVYKMAAMSGLLPNHSAANEIESPVPAPPTPVEARRPFRYSDTLSNSGSIVAPATNTNSEQNSLGTPSDKSTLNGYSHVNGNGTSDTVVTNGHGSNGTEYYSRKKTSGALSENPLKYLESLDLDSDKEEEETKVKETEDEPSAVVPATEESEEESEEEDEQCDEVVSAKLEIKVDPPLVQKEEEEKEEEPEQIAEKTNTFIGSAVDIDDLLSRTSHFFAYDGSPVDFENIAEEKGEAEEDTEDADSLKPRNSTALDDKPWWERFKDEQENKTEPLEEKKTEENIEDEGDNGEEEGDVAEEEYEEEGEDEGDGEEEGEWEYYTDEEEVQEDEEEDQFQSVKEEVADPEDKDENKEWIVECIKQIIPNTPTKPPKKTVVDSDDSEDQDYTNLEDMKAVENMYSENHGYRDWLKDVAGEISKNQILDHKESTDIPLEGETVAESKARSRARGIVDKLKEDGTSLKQVLFSLKDVFQSESNLVYEFVELGGLQRLVELGVDEGEAQLQNFVLRALGQLMLYVDGMKGVMENISAIELLYKLISSENRLVVKTAIKLLLVFIDYNESNYLILLQAVRNVATNNEDIPWKYLISLMLEEETFDPELCTFALTLVNKTLYEIDDQNTFYEQTDFMEDLGIEKITEMTSDDSIPNTLLEEIQLYNVALKQEDGEQVTEEDISALYQDSSLRLRTSLRTKSNTFKPRKSLRYKISQVKGAEVDLQGDIEEVGFNDLKRILAKNGLPSSPSGDSLNQLSEGLTGFLLKAKDAFLAKINKGETGSPVPPDSPQPDEREGELQWKQIQDQSTRPLIICDLDFTDLKYEEEEQQETQKSGGIPVPPPLPPPAPPAAPPPPGAIPNAPLPPPALPMVPKDKQLNPITNFRKTKKTIKLFWRELRQRPDTIPTVWDELHPISVDHKVLEYLFESRAKESFIKESTKVQTGPMREIVVLDHKRSNFINIGMTKLPPPRYIYINIPFMI